jgi:predicted TIM-barrel fold metal-dependent hydrolase
MRRIALEEHVLPADLADEVMGAHSGHPDRIREALADVGEGRLAVMDAAGIDVQVLSVVAPGSQVVEADRAVGLAAELNDRVAGTVRAHPDRFDGLASLPTQNPAAAAEEARRAVEGLGFCGVVLNGHTGGRFLDEPEFEPVLSAVESLGVPIYLHPTYPPKAVAEVYYRGATPALDRLATAGWGWHVETGMHVLRMAAGGVFDRHPGLQVVVGHMGENLPFSLLRADAVLTPQMPGSRSLAETVRSHVHLTISGYTTVPPLRCALDVFGADRILFAADHPFGDSAAHARFLDEAPISPADREKIAHGNAEALFKL